jgi:hypothetical protein
MYDKEHPHVYGKEHPHVYGKEHPHATAQQTRKGARGDGWAAARSRASSSSATM